MALTALGLAELALVKAGAKVPLGAGVAAASSYFAEGAQSGDLKIAAE